MAAKMEASMETTEGWIPDESYLSDQNHFNAIKELIKAHFENTPDDATHKDDVHFISDSFLTLHNLLVTDELKRTEALHSIQGMWENFTSITKFQPPPMPKSLSSPITQNP